MNGWSVGKRLRQVQVIGLLVAACAASGCAHTLDVKNLQLYKAAFINSQAAGA